MNRIKLTNNTDLDKAHEGSLPVESVRSVEIEALVDTGATMLALPEEVVVALGVPLLGMRRVRDARGIVVEVGWARSIHFEILGREMTCDALVLPPGARALIGQIQLESLDLIVDAKAQEVRVNPASPDMPLLDLMACA